MDADTLREHLDTLGVSEDCSDDALTQAYRDLVKIWHPDRFAHDGRLRLKAEEQLKRINNAYEWLRKYRRETSSTRSRPSPDSSSSSGQQPGDVVFCANCGVSLRVPEGASYLRCPSCKHEQDRNGAPRPQRPPAQPDDSPVDDTNETEMPLAAPPNPFAIPMIVLLAGIAVLVVLRIVLTRVESGVPKDDTQAVAWLAEQGFASAQYRLGWAYQYGQGVPQDFKQAVAWYRKAAEQGFASAQYSLGWTYHYGQGVPQDFRQAVAWYRKAAEQGFASAQYSLGLMYQYGQGVPKDDVVSYMWLNLAVSWSSGDEQGSYIRGRDEIAARLTPRQLANGQRMAREWQAALETPQSQPQFEQAPEPPIRSTRVALVAEGGTYLVPVQINGVLTLHFTVDSGASDVTIPADVVMTLYRTGTIRDEDFIGDKQYQLADGSIINSRTFRIRSLTVGSQTLTGVTGSVADIKGSLLLGQSFLSRFRSWAMDNETHELVLEPK